jgi:putative FmdB family regulatory protein
MPIFEYICTECEREFEVIIQGDKKPECPSCRSRRLDKKLSVFAAGSKAGGLDTHDVPVTACGTCGDPRGPGSCSIN